MLRKKIYKILSVLVAVIIAFSLFCIPVSALQEVWFSCDKPVVTDNSGYVEVVSSAGTFVFVVYSYDTEKPFFYTTYDENGYLYFYCNAENQLDRANCYSYYLTQDGKAIATPFWVSEKYSYFRVNDIYKINGYNVDVSRVSAQVPTNPYSFYYSADVIINDNLNSIMNILYTQFGVTTSIENNVGMILNYSSHQLEAIRDILDELKQGNSDIIKNQDENTDKVIQNQEENQEEIKNGWQQDESIDTTTTDDYAAKDKELQEATEQGRSEAVSVFNSFGSLFQSDGHLYKGLLSVSAMFSQFMKIDWLSSLLNFSLAIGVFAFVIGTGSEVFKSSHERYKDYKISKIDSYDERWLI